MELSEARAKTHYRHSFDKIPEAASIVEDEIRHEAELIELLDERHLRHVSSIILGLNDALIEMLPATRRRYGVTSMNIRAPWIP